MGDKQTGTKGIEIENRLNPERQGREGKALERKKAGVDRKQGGKLLAKNGMKKRKAAGGDSSAENRSKAPSKWTAPDKGPQKN